MELISKRSDKNSVDSQAEIAVKENPINFIKHLEITFTYVIHAFCLFVICYLFEIIEGYLHSRY